MHTVEKATYIELKNALQKVIEPKTFFHALKEKEGNITELYCALWKEYKKIESSGKNKNNPIMQIKTINKILSIPFFIFILSK